MNDWQITFNGLTVGNSTYGIDNISGLLDNPEVRSSDQLRARAHGQFAGVDLLGGRDVAFDITVVAPHPSETAWQELSRAFRVAQATELPLVVQVPGLAGGVPVQLGARVRKFALPVSMDYTFGVGSASVEFHCTDPRIYAANASSTSIDQAPLSVSGLTFPATFPLSFGGAASGGTGVVSNDGEIAAPWTATIRGPVTNPRIENQDTGQVLSFTGTVGPSQTLVLSSLNRTVMLNGDSSRYSWIDAGSQWFDFEPGTTSLRFAGTAGSGNLLITYRSAWI